MKQYKDVHTAQVITDYSPGMHKPGLLLNFNVAVLRNGIRMVIKKCSTSEKDYTKKKSRFMIIKISLSLIKKLETHI